MGPMSIAAESRSGATKVKVPPLATAAAAAAAAATATSANAATGAEGCDLEGRSAAVEGLSPASAAAAGLLQEEERARAEMLHLPFPREKRRQGELLAQDSHDAARARAARVASRERLLR